MQLALLDPLPHMLQPLGEVLGEDRVGVDLRQLREERLVVGDEFEQQVCRIRTLVEREQPVHRLLPEDAHRPEHDVVKPHKPVFRTDASDVVFGVGVGVGVVAVEQRVRVEKGRLVVDEPEGAGGGAHRQVVDRFPENGRTFLLLGTILEKKLKSMLVVVAQR